MIFTKILQEMLKPKEKIKKVIGLMKGELCGKIKTKFVG